MFDFYNKKELIDNNKIFKIKKRLEQAKVAVKDAQYIEDLIFSDYVSAIRASSTVWDYHVSTIKSAQKEIYKTTEKERSNLIFVESLLRDMFFKNETRFELKIKNIICGGDEGYYWNMYFTVNNEDFIIQIPIRNRINKTNVNYANFGMFVFLKVSYSMCTALQFEAWDEESFSKKLKDYFDNYFNEVLKDEKEN